MKIYRLIAGCMMLGWIAVASCQTGQSWRSPVGYDFTKPIKYNMPSELHEISGITFRNQSDTLYTEEDEHGRVYYLKPGDKSAKFSEFRPKGDFEDIAIAAGQVVMLQSKGRLFTFPLAELGKPQITDAKENDGILPEGEFEGIYANPQTDSVYVMCKHCSVDKTSKDCSGFIFQLAHDGTVKQVGDFNINVKHIEAILGKDKISFHPSALTQNPLSKDWYILSSVNKILVVANSKWKIEQVYPLNPDTFPQPEGITFDKDNNLWISNEGQSLSPGNVLKFPFHKPD